MRKTRTLPLAMLMLCVAASSALARYAWNWTYPYNIVPGNDYSTEEYYLTEDNGSHAVAMTKYDGYNGTSVWTSILTQRWRSTAWDPHTEYIGWIQAYEYENIGADWQNWDQKNPYWPFEPDPDPDDSGEYRAVNCHVANNPRFKTYTWGNLNRQVAIDTPAGYGVPTDGRPLTYQGDAWWNAPHDFSAELNDSMAKDMGVAAALFNGPNTHADSHGVAVWVSHQMGDLKLRRAVTTNGGAQWIGGSGYYIVRNQHPLGDTWWRHPSLATDNVNGRNAYLAYESTAVGGWQNHIMFRRSPNWGEDWDQNVARLGIGEGPCVAAVGPFVFVSWSRLTGGTPRQILYRVSADSGATWHPDTAVPPDTVPFDIYTNTPGYRFKYGRQNVTAVPTPDPANPARTIPGVIVVAQLAFPLYDDPSFSYYTTRGIFGLFRGTTAFWEENIPLCMNFHNTQKQELICPSIAAITADGLEDLPLPVQPDVIATCIMSTPGLYSSSGHHIRKANGYYADLTCVAAPSASTARLLAIDADGVEHYGSARWPYVASGQVFDGIPIYDFGANGRSLALAADGDGARWATYVESDTLWIRPGRGEPEMVFAGSSSAVPGQPSIACYPNQANGVYVGNVVFPVYDTAGGASRIMYARVDTGGVVLDTIESVNTLRDSLPCISIYKGDTLLCTYQHGDSVLSRLLADYGPATQGQPPAWSSANLVTASGYHPMSVMEDGSVLNCAYTYKNGSDYSIKRSTNDLSGGMFGNWVAMTAPSAGSNVEKANPVYAGVGASVWQQKANGKWVIKGFVRGAETTLVANDTDAYHPHAVAESSAVSPSIDQVRVHLLYTAGVAFEVDSGVYDTGETRYKCESLNVSHAGSDATRCNNGAKLLRKDGSDSLFAAYSDADGAVVYAWSAAGDSWCREIVTTERSYPAIAADSTGKRWVVARTADGSLPAAQYLYYQSGGSWTSQSLYSGMDLLGPASLAGASSTTTGIAYAAFKVEGMSTQYIVLTKFNGTTVSACTVATGSNLGDPSVAVEAYKTDSDHVHVTWEDAGVVKYRMDTDGRSYGIANTWTSVVSLSDAQATSHHPAISADHDQVVAAWAQGATADIYYRKRSTDSTYNNWEAAANLSNTANDASDWPTIAMGDTVVVAWEETRSAYDHDILACIDFGDTLNVADNATVSGYPHVLFYNKTSGDTAIPYLHTIWSETPSESYYEVGYDKLNLKQSSGEGQQSTSSVPIPTKPTLTSCSPNPFRDRTQIRYALPTEGNVSLRVYDATGRTVRTLASGHQKAGSYSVTWDSRDNRGRQVPRGVYFYRLDMPGFRSVKKAVVAR